MKCWGGKSPGTGTVSVVLLGVVIQEVGSGAEGQEVDKA